jgi:hypothetical protein
MLVSFLFTSPQISIIEPSGQIQPQKNLPKIRVNMSIPAARIIPGSIILSLIEVKNIIRGFILKKVSGGRSPFKGYVVDQRM